MLLTNQKTLTQLPAIITTMGIMLDMVMGDTGMGTVMDIMDMDMMGMIMDT